MSYTVSQVKCNDKGRRLTEIEYYYCNSYQDALELFNRIKDDDSNYKLKEKEFICTQMHDSEGKLLELHKHRKYEKWFK